MSSIAENNEEIHVPTPNEIFLRAGKIIEEAEEKEIREKVQFIIDTITEDLAQRLAYWQKNKIKSANNFETVDSSFETKNVPEVYGIIELDTPFSTSAEMKKYPREISLLIASLEEYYNVDLTHLTEEEYTSGLSSANKSLYKSLIITLKDNIESQNRKESATKKNVPIINQGIPSFSVLFDTEKPRRKRSEYKF